MRVCSRAALVALTLLPLQACGDGGAASDGVPTRDVDLRNDPRLFELLKGCPALQAGFYDRNTSDVVGILLEKLMRGQVEPLRRAKVELGLEGAEAVAGLRRIIERHSAQALESPFVENALEALGQNPHPDARPVLLRMLDHPQETVRKRALSGLLRHHAQAEDFDRLRNLAAGPEGGGLRLQAAKGLFQIDRGRAEPLVLDWFEAKEYEAVWRPILPLLALSEDPEIARRCARMLQGASPSVRPWLAAIADRSGDEGARKVLQDGLTQGGMAVRLPFMSACIDAQRLELIGPRVHEETDDTLRAMAADALGRATEGDERELDWLRTALDDPASMVRQAALKHLVRLGQPEAVARAVAYLNERSQLVEESLHALRARFPVDEALVRQVFDELRAKLERERHLPPRDRIATYKSFGFVPLADAAQLMREEGLALAGDTIEGLRAHEWLMIQAANTGLAGRTYLADQLEVEQDPVRRMDLVAALASHRDELGRERLLALLTRTDVSVHEKLYISERLVRLGPTSRVAERLKRLSHALEDTEARVALQCLLWKWY